MKERLKAAFIGAVAGGVGSLVGLGGSFVALPMLTGWLRMNQHLAHGTTMASVLCTSLGGSLAYSLQRNEKLKDDHSKNQKSFDRIGNVHLLSAVGLASASSVTVVLGAKISKSLSVRTLKLSMGSLLLLVAPLISFRETLQKYSSTSQSKEDHNLLVSLVIGSITGVISGIFGVGGGALQVPALSIFTNLDYHTILGTSLAAMLPTSVIGSFTHYWQGTLVPRIAVPLGLGCLLGSFVMSHLANVISDQELKKVFPAVMLWLGINSIRQGLRIIR